MERSRLTTTTTTSNGLLLFEAARLNQEAILSFIGGQRSNAAQMLSHVLSLLKTYLQDEEDEEDIESSFDADASITRPQTFSSVMTELIPNNLLPAAPFRPCQMSTLSLAQQSEIPACAINKDMLHYEKAFLCIGTDVPYNVKSVCAIVLYNMALFFHQHAELTNSISCYTKAIDMYTHSIKLLKTMEDDGLLHTSITLLSVLAAALHNLSYCKVVAYLDRDYAAYCQDALARTLQNISDYYNNNNNDNNSDSDDNCNNNNEDDEESLYDFFYTALMVADHRDHAHRVAPAA